MRARLRLRGAARGRLRIAWSTTAIHAVATLRGAIGGRPVHLSLPAP